MDEGESAPDVFGFRDKCASEAGERGSRAGAASLLRLQNPRRRRRPIKNGRTNADTRASGHDARGWDSSRNSEAKIDSTAELDVEGGANGYDRRGG